MEDSYPKLRFTQFSYSIITGNHREEIKLFVIPSPHSPVVLGLPWFKLRKPHTDWRNKSITNWSIHCHSHCLRSANPSSPHLQVLPRQIDLSAVPLEYFDLALKGAAPPTGLTSMSPLFCWSSEFESAFGHLKQLFTMAPVLRDPDPPPLPFSLWLSLSLCESTLFPTNFSLEVCLPLRGTTTWETESCWPTPLDLPATVVFSTPYSFYRKVSNGLA